MEEVIVRAPSNIALIKYWGKKNVEFNLPTNSSISLTLDVNYLHTETKLKFTHAHDSVVVNLNSKVISLSSGMKKVVSYFKARVPEELARLGVEVDTFNNFPTGAGLASSASGLAAFGRV